MIDEKGLWFVHAEPRVSSIASVFDGLVKWCRGCEVQQPQTSDWCDEQMSSTSTFTSTPYPLEAVSGMVACMYE